MSTLSLKRLKSEDIYVREMKTEGRWIVSNVLQVGGQQLCILSCLKKRHVWVVCTRVLQPNIPTTTLKFRFFFLRCSQITTCFHFHLYIVSSERGGANNQRRRKWTWRQAVRWRQGLYLMRYVALIGKVCLTLAILFLTALLRVLSKLLELVPFKLSLVRLISLPLMVMLIF